ncbi:MAG: UDP-N-acetylmuramoyl-L-alanine--D-glutamate ligase [Lentisphaeria bacterium]|nr:UDP-N-acetylmuramoyl-L-alanine--D-glutamate ligase [Lentisphaeria bacterium]NQZ66777.1 UDP-N-acetylmuramoyl-L-alanine--D-glutamate ligase [Lentisphaeria bacterium]
MEAKVLVLGLGISGESVAKRALQNADKPTILDSRVSPDLEAKAAYFRERGVKVELGYASDNLQELFDLAVISPGISHESPLGQLAKNLDCPVISEIEFAARLISSPVIAVTGTNGKTTTVELLVHCLKSAGFTAEAAGNIGVPLTEFVDKKPDFIVAEISSFQLEAVAEFRPMIAVCTNISDDHLDRYDSFDSYKNTKLKVFNGLDSQYCILQKKLEPAYESCFAQQAVTFSVDEAADYYVDDRYIYHADEKLLDTRTFSLQGSHNIENTMIVAAVCSKLQVSMADVQKAMESFQLPEHRQEIVAEWNQITFVNDSKATNPDALIQAIKRFGQAENIILLAGGLDKSMDFTATIPWVQQHVKDVLLIGKNQEKLESIWCPYKRTGRLDSLEEAVNKAIDIAKSGDCVLLSPGSASQDMFTNYIERGEQFRNAVKRRLRK